MLTGLYSHTYPKCDCSDDCMQWGVNTCLSLDMEVKVKCPHLIDESIEMALCLWHKLLCTAVPVTS